MNLDDIKVTIASATGLGSWLVAMDNFLKVGISILSLLYIAVKLKQLLERKRKYCHTVKEHTGVRLVAHQKRVERLMQQRGV